MGRKIFRGSLTYSVHFRTMSLLCEENVTDIFDDSYSEDKLRAQLDKLKQQFTDHQHNLHESGVKHATFGEMIALAEKVCKLETKLLK